MRVLFFFTPFVLVLKVTVQRPAVFRAIRVLPLIRHPPVALHVALALDGAVMILLNCIDVPLRTVTAFDELEGVLGGVTNVGIGCDAVVVGGAVGGGGVFDSGAGCDSGSGAGGCVGSVVAGGSGEVVVGVPGEVVVGTPGALVIGRVLARAAKAALVVD